MPRYGVIKTEIPEEIIITVYPQVLSLISHATQERLKSLVSKLSVIAEHRLDVIKTEGGMGEIYPRMFY